MDDLCVTRAIAEQLIIRDKNWSRFQRFAVDLISAADGLQYATSALSHDKGRDGRTPLISTENLKYVVCSSTKETPQGAVAKVVGDFKRLKETGLPIRVAFCFTCELQEKHKQAIWEKCRAISGDCGVRAEGVEYLAQAAENHADIFKRHYSGELLALRHGLLSESPELSGKSIGLRIAMATQFGEDAISLRLSAMANLVRLSLARESAGLARSTLLHKISSELGLTQRVNAAYLDSTVGDLEKSGELMVRGAFVELTTAGKEKAGEIIKDARGRLLNGRDTFFEEMNQGLVRSLDGDTFDYLWARLQDGIADLLLSEGMAVVRTILAPGNESGVSIPNESALLAQLSIRIIPITIPKEEQIVLSHTILRVLTGQTKTRSWLCQIAATFVSICALGLHPLAQEERLNRLRAWTLLVDNHVAISFICNGEADHDGVRRVINAWITLKREVATCVAVLEEAAYSAFHSEQEYQENWRTFGTLNEDGAKDVIKNPFVRAFHRISAGGYEPTRWKAYIANYRGSSEFDGGKLKIELSEAGWKVIDDTTLSHETVKELKNFLSPGSKASLWRRRAEWDARTAMAAMHWHRKKSDSDGSIVIVTKSDAIRMAIDWIDRHSMGRLSIMSVSALAYAMALTPQLSLNLTHIRELLFDPNLVSKAFGGLEPQARRIALHDREEGFELAGTSQLKSRLQEAIASEFGRIDGAVEGGKQVGKRKSRIRKLR